MTSVIEIEKGSLYVHSHPLKDIIETSPLQSQFSRVKLVQKELFVSKEQLTSKALTEYSFRSSEPYEVIKLFLKLKNINIMIDTERIHFPNVKELKEKLEEINAKIDSGKIDSEIGIELQFIQERLEKLKESEPDLQEKYYKIIEKLMKVIPITKEIKGNQIIEIDDETLIRKKGNKLQIIRI